jgi:hypothetical protein
MEDIQDENGGFLSNEDIVDYVAAGVVASDEVKGLSQQETEDDDDQASQDIFAQLEGSTADVIAKEIQVAATPAGATREDPECADVNMQLEDALKYPEAYENGYHSGHDKLEEDIATSSLPPQQHAIEVVLRPPSDPESYEYIPRSRTVIRVLDEIDNRGKKLYEVEFRDGRIKYVSVSLKMKLFVACCLLPVAHLLFAASSQHCSWCGYLEFLELNNSIHAYMPTNLTTRTSIDITTTLLTNQPLCLCSSNTLPLLLSAG